MEIRNAVHPLRSQHQQLHIYMGHGRRKSDLHRYGCGTDGGFEVKGEMIITTMRKEGKMSG